MYPDNTDQLQVNMTTPILTLTTYTDLSRSHSPTQPLTPTSSSTTSSNSSSVGDSMDIQQHTGFTTTDDDMSDDDQQHQPPGSHCRKRRMHTQHNQSTKRLHTSADSRQQHNTPIISNSPPLSTQSAVLTPATPSLSSMPPSSTPVPLPHPSPLLQTNNKQCNKLVKWLSLLGTRRVKQLVMLLSTFMLLFVSFTTSPQPISQPPQQQSARPHVAARTFPTHRTTILFNYTTVTRMHALHMRHIPPQHIYLQRHHTFMQRQPLQLTASIGAPTVQHRVAGVQRVIQTVGGWKWLTAIAGVLSAVVCYLAHTLQTSTP